jgi:tRNA nucleotidyltransferase/poly(A) polymerase
MTWQKIAKEIFPEEFKQFERLNGRRPDAVEFTDIASDVQRRDLTINALFYDIDKGEIVDFVGGIDDIQNGIVKAVGDPGARFAEDRLRILRALRFATRMGSQLDPATAQAIKNDNKLSGVSPERIRDEFLKGILATRSVPSFLDMMEEYDLWPQVFPGLNVARVPIDTKNVPVVLARLLWGNAPDLVAKRLNALKYSADEVAQVTFLLRFKDLTPENAFRLRKAYLISKLSDKDLIEFAAMKSTPEPRLVRAFLKYRPTITGDELMAQGFTGAQLGKEMERRETELFKELL